MELERGAEGVQLRKKTTLIDLEKAFREVCLIKTKSSNHMFSMCRKPPIPRARATLISGPRSVERGGG